MRRTTRRRKGEKREPHEHQQKQRAFFFFSHKHHDDQKRRSRSVSESVIEEKRRRKRKGDLWSLFVGFVFKCLVPERDVGDDTSFISTTVGDVGRIQKFGDIVFAQALRERKGKVLD